MWWAIIDWLPTVALAIMALVVVFWAPIVRWWRLESSKRGRTEIHRKEKSDPKPEQPAIRFGNSWLPWEAGTQHFLFAGASGAGKSHMLNLTIREPLRHIREGSDARAVFFDTKQDVSALLYRMGVTAPVFSFNPFEASSPRVRSVMWDIAADVTGTARPLNLAAALIPKSKNESQPFFTNAPRGVVNGVVKSFIRHADEWYFHDLVQALLSRSTTEEILRRDNPGQRVIENCLPAGQTGDNVMSTVYANLLYYEPIAALWQRFPKHDRLSVREWLHSESVITLGANADAKIALECLNQQIFSVMTNEIDLQVDSSTRRIHVVIDEARLAGSLLKGELLPFLAVKGRSKGVCLYLAFQDMEGLIDAAGEKLAKEIVGQMSHKALLRSNSHYSSSWASQEVGEYDQIEFHTSDSSSFSRSISSSYSGKRDAVLPSEFRAIPQPSPERGVTGYFVSPEFEPYRGTVPGSEVAEVVLSDEREDA